MIHKPNLPNALASLALFSAISIFPSPVFSQTSAAPAPQQKAAEQPPLNQITPYEKLMMDVGLNDWPYLAKYHDANKELPAPALTEARVVFLGDSITEGWGQQGSPAAPDRHEFFPGKPYVNRGSSGQTTPQMLVRFRQDVIHLQPKVVVILAGINDIAENTGKTTLEAIEDNFQSMAEIARANGIRVVLCSVLPATDFPWRPGLAPAPKVKALNVWLKDYAAKNNLVYVDYYSPMANSEGGLKADLGSDGVHPNKAGYAIMAPLAEAAIAEALKKPVS